ncbi:MAG: stage II sporulation protein M [Nanoarchaeota archaeon]|nr:stage II sporulation protein M [Nanoarchaeota archaeon]
MFETFLYKSIEKHNYINVFILTLIITLLLAILNYYIGANAMFLVAFISLALSFPMIRYFRKLNNLEIKRIYSSNKLLYNHIEEIIMCWVVFIAVGIGFFIATTTGLITQFTYHEAFVGKLIGMITNYQDLFTIILLNNLIVGLFTFLLSFLVFSGMIFVLVWNASLVAYYLYSLQSSQTALITSLLILPHGLLEVGGYVLAGIAGGLLAYRFEVWNSLNKEEQKEFRKDLFLLVSFSICLIVIGAVIESF